MYIYTLTYLYLIPAPPGHMYSALWQNCVSLNHQNWSNSMLCFTWLYFCRVYSHNYSVSLPRIIWHWHPLLFPFTATGVATSSTHSLTMTLCNKTLAHMKWIFSKHMCTNICTCITLRQENIDVHVRDIQFVELYIHPSYLDMAHSLRVGVCRSESEAVDVLLPVKSLFWSSCSNRWRSLSSLRMCLSTYMLYGSSM